MTDLQAQTNATVPPSSALTTDFWVLDDLETTDDPQQPQPSSSSPNRILGLLPFTKSAQDIFQADSFDHMVAGLMALDHFHSANPIVVPELASWNCSGLNLDSIFVNSRANTITVANFLMQQVGYEWLPEDRPIAVVGVPTNDVALLAADYAIGMDIPIVSMAADSTSLTHDFFYGGMGGCTNVHLDAMGEMVVDFIVRQQGRRHALATIATTHEFGADLRLAIERNVRGLMCEDDEEEGVQVPCFNRHDSYGLAPPFDGYAPNEGAGWALQQIQKRGTRNIVLVLNYVASQIRPVANMAAELGFLSEERRGDYVWILATERGTNMNFLADLAAHNQNVSSLLDGIATLVTLDGFRYNQDDPFLRAWRQQNATMVDRVNQMYPIQSSNESGYFQAPPDYFQTHDPLPGSGFMYDTMMSVALGKCILEQTPSQGQEDQKNPPLQGNGPPTQNDESDSPPPEGNSPPPNQNGNDAGNNSPPINNNTRQRHGRGLKGVHTRPSKRRQLQGPPPPKGPPRQQNAFVDAIRKVDFQGATGRVKFGDDPNFGGSRSPDTVAYGVLNFRRGDTSSTTASPMNVYLTAIHHGPADGLGEWTTGPDGQFIYPNGLSTPPLLNMDLPNQNYLSPAIHITGLVFMSIALATAIASAAFIIVKWNAAPVRQAQPPFLLLLILGTILMSLSILTSAFDENTYYFTHSMLDAACAATPFMVFMGYNIVYMALFSKLYRVNKVMQFRRVEITVAKVAAPFVVNMLFTIGILIAWTVASPFQWKRSIIDNDTMESYGRCQSEKTLPFLVPLLFLMALSTLGCATMAFTCRDIDERFSDSNFIFYTIFVQIQVLLVGIPILVILDDASADAAYLGKSLLIFVMVMTTLLLMIVPKAMLVFGLVQKGSRNAGAGSLRVSGMNVMNNVVSELSRPSAVSTLRDEKGLPSDSSPLSASFRDESASLKVTNVAFDKSSAC